MADEDLSGADDRTEEATQERRDDFREKGQIAVSREVMSVVALATVLGFSLFYSQIFVGEMKDMLVTTLGRIRDFKAGPGEVQHLLANVSYRALLLIAPFFILVTVSTTTITFFQTRFNFSWARMSPDFKKLSPLKGIVRLVNFGAVFELIKGVLKLSIVGFIGILILKGEWIKVPNLMNTSIRETWQYWADITSHLFFSVLMLLVALAALDFFVSFMKIERQLKMTKKEVKDEMKRREVDPHVKGRMRRMQRDIIGQKMMDKTKEATVIVTNPTHFAIALKFELGMRAPVVVAKGKDFLALRMRELAKELDIPIVENKPLARAMFRLVDVGGEIPDSLYKAVAEIIRFVFKQKGKSLFSASSKAAQPESAGV